MPNRMLPCKLRRCLGERSDAARCRMLAGEGAAANGRNRAFAICAAAQAHAQRPSRSPGASGAEERSRARPAAVQGARRGGKSPAAEAAERRARETALREAEEKFAALLDLTPEAVALIRLSDGVVLAASRAFPGYFGYAGEDMVGRSACARDLGLWVDDRQRRRWRERILAEREVRDFRATLRRKDGAPIAALVSGERVEVGGEPCALFEACDDPTSPSVPIAYRDGLTGLPNRMLLSDRLRQAIGQNQRTGGRIAVCSLGLDGFKEVAGRVGRSAADRLLIEAARRLEAGVRSGDTVARLGDDEFAVLFSGLTRDDEWEPILERVLRSLSAPYSVRDGQPIEISAIAGVTLFPSDPADADTLVRHADRALYAARQSGKNRYRLFDARIERRFDARHATLQRLAEALKTDQFRLYYQPQVDCRRGRCVGVEALIRWRHPTLGLLSPAEFLPLIEESDLAPQVGEWVIGEALAQIGRWRGDGVDLMVSVNAFARHLLRPDFASALAARLDGRPEDERRRLRIEIVETAALADLDAVRQMIEECRKLGVTFSLDDFGTGYSTLAHVRHLPVAELKIDQSFVRHMLARAEDLAIVEVVIRLGRAFGRTLVAEGVETAAHIQRLIALGCDIMQGYALARPMPADDVPRWVGEFRADPAWLTPAGAAAGP